MTALPPAGWFPDPEAGDRWRWWDGYQWAPAGYGYARQWGYDPAGRARWLEAHARTTSSTGRWLRLAFPANAVATLLTLIGLAIAFRGGFHIVTNDAGGTSQVSHGWIVLQLFSAPTSIVNAATFVLFIAWIYNAGKFADLQGLPRVRDRVLGAFSLLIPVVNFWWPYEAIRDLFPPGARPAFLVRWWVSYLVIPMATVVSVFVATLFGSLLVCCVVLVASAGALTIPAVLGRRLVAALDEVQRFEVTRAGGA